MVIRTDSPKTFQLVLNIITNVPILVRPIVESEGGGGSPCETNVLISKLGFVSVLEPKNKGQWNCPRLKNRKRPPLLSFNILAWDILRSLLFKEDGFSFGVMKPSLTIFTLILNFLFSSFLIWIGDVAKKLTTKFVDFYK